MKYLQEYKHTLKSEDVFQKFFHLSVTQTQENTLRFFRKPCIKIFEVQDAHFSGNQYYLHCAIVEHGENKYVYHLSDDTNHDTAFVHEVLENIFQRWYIKNET